eukprot:GHVR01177528.1.p1 GENE.GHVR01177528.1~~GHVR01177528.1.p1  ORF type:complete len:129 (-),score=36.08 GHVR01177528.1:115-501(-)
MSPIRNQRFCFIASTFNRCSSLTSIHLIYAWVWLLYPQSDDMEINQGNDMDDEMEIIGSVISSNNDLKIEENKQIVQEEEQQEERSGGIVNNIKGDTSDIPADDDPNDCPRFVSDQESQRRNSNQLEV